MGQAMQRNRSGEVAMAAIEQELLDQIRKLDTEQQRRVLDFVRTLTSPKGEPVKDFLERTRGINFPKEALE
jgi:hypothetical protein